MNIRFRWGNRIDLARLNNLEEKEMEDELAKLAKSEEKSLQDFINTPDTYNYSLLMCAAAQNCHLLAQFLIAQQANINFQGAGGLTALHVACQNDSPHAVREILDSKEVNLDLKDTLGRTAKKICVSHLPNQSFKGYPMRWDSKESKKIKGKHLPTLNLFVRYEVKLWKSKQPQQGEINNRSRLGKVSGSLAPSSSS